MNQNWLIGLIAAVTLVIGIFAGLYIAPPQQSVEPKYLQMYPQARALPEFNLVDQDGAAFTNQALQNKWTLIFTGYTYCPDICPTTLADLSQVYSQLGQSVGEENEVSVLFLSVDPKRDTPERLKEYVHFFHRDFIAATAEHQQLFPLVRAMGMMYALNDDGENPDYLVDHSASIVVVNPQAQVVGRFKPELKPGQLTVSDVQQVLHDMPLIANL